ncbi:transglutaminase-like domain-containing protein [Eisenibacter elegans]|jgi:transglutaminase-like putative cysteine protease|uniref:transglutaminase-like domain-containing protein n=1 Tax=Eisenibacter elegans TaxID=997 RepID=UPI0003FF4882|nr:transglutaminase-like domain-containing protein [Eisenibacter elegans]
MATKLKNIPNTQGLAPYLRSTDYLDSNHPEVRAFAEGVVSGLHDEAEKAVELYYAVRDGFKFDLKDISLRMDDFKASALLTKGQGSAVEKNNLLVAAYRSVGLPARLGYVNFRNPWATHALGGVLRSEVMAFHPSTQVFLGDHWVTLYPSFDAVTAQQYQLRQVPFGMDDTYALQDLPADQQQVEILAQFHPFVDFPHNLFVQTLKEHYAHLFSIVQADDEVFLAYLDTLDLED